MISRSRIRARRLAPILYGQVVAAARAPALYLQLGVADTIEGRYEMIVLHLALLFRRLRQSGSEIPGVAQAVVDYMAADLDRSVRELGVGDLSVSRYMKRLGEGLFGRATAYDAALDASDSRALSAALARNVYGGVEPGLPILAAMTDYVEDQSRHVAAIGQAALGAGEIRFLDPGGYAP
jgi:cytochrome b pre-mRNA-processing protein 3